MLLPPRANVVPLGILVSGLTVLTVLRANISSNLTDKYFVGVDCSVERAWRLGDPTFGTKVHCQFGCQIDARFTTLPSIRLAVWVTALTQKRSG